MRNSTSLLFLGDVVPGGILAFNLEKRAVDDNVHQLLSSADIVCANLESPLGIAKWARQSSSVNYSRPEDSIRLKELNLHIVSLANNHMFDLGERGFVETTRLLDDMGILYCGAGLTEIQARKPVYKEVHGVKIGFLAYSDNISGTLIAESDSPGVAHMNEAAMLEDVEYAARECDYLYIILHWGSEYTWLPDPQSHPLAKALLEHGASGIIGGHSHRPQAYWRYNKKPVFYSLGNFLYPDYVLAPPGIIDYSNDVHHYDLFKLPVMKVRRKADRYYLRKWRCLSRVGQIAIITVKNKSQRVRVKYTQSDLIDSRLRILPTHLSLAINIWLKIIGLFVNSICYPLLYSVLYRFIYLPLWRPCKLFVRRLTRH